MAFEAAGDAGLRIRDAVNSPSRLGQRFGPDFQLARRRPPGVYSRIKGRVMLDIPVFIDFSDKRHGLFSGAERPFYRQVHQVDAVGNPDPEGAPVAREFKTVGRWPGQPDSERKRGGERMICRTRQSVSMSAGGLAGEFVGMASAAGSRSDEACRALKNLKQAREYEDRGRTLRNFSAHQDHFRYFRKKKPFLGQKFTSRKEVRAFPGNDCLTSRRGKNIICQALRLG